jgi:hypothetical protein
MNYYYRLIVTTYEKVQVTSALSLQKD